MEKVKIAVIGCGKMGAFPSDLVKKYSPDCWQPLGHIEASLSTSKAKIVGVSDFSENTLKRVNKKYNINNLYTDYNELLSQQNIDLICIATRTPGRAEIIKDVASKGISHIHTEKPLCNSSVELLFLEELREKNKLQITYGTLRRYMAVYQKAKNIVEGGAYGKLIEIEINHGHSQLYWSHPHSVDLILFFANDDHPISVQSSLSNFDCNKNGSIYTVDSDPFIESATIFFKDGLIGRIGKGSGYSVVLSCEKGLVIIESDGLKIITKKIKGDDPYFQKIDAADRVDYYKPPIEGTFSAIHTLLESIKNPLLSVDSEHIFIGQRVLFAFVLSHIQNGARVNPNKMDKTIIINAKTGDFYA